MKIKHFIQVSMLLLYLNIDTLAQTSIILYPVDGSVFQHNQGTAIINFSGQVYNPNTGTQGTRYYRLEKKNGTTWSIYNGVLDVSLTTNLSYSGLNPNSTIKTFYYTLSSLPIGWYRITTYIKETGTNIQTDEDQRYFGVGDVYYIAGQSNASGYFDSDQEDPTDNVIPYYNDVTPNEMARVYSYAEDYGADQKPITKGLPYQKTFREFNHGSSSDLVPMYPNGKASWCWSNLASKIANEKGIPTVFFNVAYPNTSLVFDWIGYPEADSTTSKNTLIGKFYQTLKTYGGTLGAKAVLWHQGERDSQEMTYAPNASAIQANYQTDLQILINGTRGILSNDLSWYISKVSYLGGGDWTPNGHDKRDFYYASSSDNCRADKSYITKRFTLQTIKDWQSSFYSATNKIYAGTDPDNYGIDKNNDGVIDTECERSSMQRIHFSGSSLGTLANGWYSALHSNTSNYSNTAVSANKLLQLTTTNASLSPDGTSCCYLELSVESPPNGGSSTYYWVKNDDGINNAFATTTNNTVNFFDYPTTTVDDGDIISCYVENNNHLYPCQPFKYTSGGYYTNPCPQNRTIINTLAGVGTQSYGALQTITASNQIYGSNITYQAGKSITLEPGFKADNSNVFMAKIGGCQ
jgi:hypothetical protein